MARQRTRAETGTSAARDSRAGACFDLGIWLGPPQADSDNVAHLGREPRAPTPSKQRAIEACCFTCSNEELGALLVDQSTFSSMTLEALLGARALPAATVALLRERYTDAQAGQVAERG